jgi:dihydrofolate reductase
MARYGREKIMKIIVCVDKCWGIGNKNQLLVHIPEDMRFFREKTVGNVIVMGRKTLESFPGGKPLNGRTNIILTRNYSYHVDGATVVHGQVELFREFEKYQSSQVFVIGGGNVYCQMLHFCDTAYITRIDASYEADTYFPNLDQNPEWYITEKSADLEYEGISYRFLCYKKRKSNDF